MPSKIDVPINLISLFFLYRILVINHVSMSWCLLVLNFLVTTCLSLGPTSMRADWPTGKFLTSLVVLRIFRLNHSMVFIFPDPNLMLPRNDI